MSPSRQQKESAREMLLWAGMTVVLAIGLVLYFRYAELIVPLLDVVTDK